MEWPPQLRGEHEVLISPRLPHQRPLSVLADAMLTQRAHCQRRKLNGPSAAGRLRFDEHELAVDCLERVADAEDACVEVDVLPAEPESLALAEPDSERDGKQCLQSITTNRGKQTLGLVRVQRGNLVAADAWRLDQRGHVARDQAPAQGLVERPPQHAADIQHALRRQARLEPVVDQALVLLRREAREADVADLREDVVADDLPIAPVGARPQRPSRALLEPGCEELSDGLLL